MSIISAGDTGVALPEISNSLRFDGTNDYLTRTPGSTTNRRTYTISAWVKRSKLSVIQYILSSYNAGTNECAIRINANDTLEVEQYTSPSYNYQLVTNQVFRDVSSHFHLLVAVDTNQATAANRILIYINGQQVTSFSTATYPSINYDTNFCLASYTNLIGSWNVNYFHDGYLSNVCFIDGQALTPSSFAYTDPNGQWRSLSKAALTTLASSGGTNSFFLPFDNGSSTTTLGADASSKGNNWTLTNMVRDGSVNDCWSYDTPTNNFATLNPLNIGAVTGVTQNGCLRFSGQTSAGGGTSNAAAAGSVHVATGKWYFEVNPTGMTGAQLGFGMTDTACSFSGGFWTSFSTYWMTMVGGTPTSSTGFANGDVLAVAVDMDNGKIWFAVNNAWILSGNPSTGANPAYTFSGKTLKPFVTDYNDDVSNAAIADLNFGQRPVSGGAWDSAAGGYFRYAPPSGFKAFNTKNLSTPTGAASAPSEHFQVKLDAGANIKTTAEAVFPSNFLEIIKDRANANNWQWLNSVTGNTAVLQSNTTSAETTYTAPTGNSVATVLKAGGAAVTNTDGSITSQVSANVLAGFSIVTYTGNNTSGATIGHGLGVVPKLIIVFARSAAGTNHVVYNSASGNTGSLYLNLTNSFTTVGTWNNTTPTSTVFTVGGNGLYVNDTTTTYVAYCFAEIPGFSKIGSYTGNSSTDGPFVWCGFRPKFVMIKRTDAAATWVLMDALRSTSGGNVVNLRLYPASSSFEETNTYVDLLANGFKIRVDATEPTMNTSGGTYIFIAFAEAPFKYSNAR